MWHDEREITLSRPGLAKGQCARESARPGILGQGRGKTCRIGVGTCGGIGSPSSFSRLKKASRSSRLPFLLRNGRILTSILPFHTPIVYIRGRTHSSALMGTRRVKTHRNGAGECGDAVNNSPPDSLRIFGIRNSENSSLALTEPRAQADEDGFERQRG